MVSALFATSHEEKIKFWILDVTWINAQECLSAGFRRSQLRSALSMGGFCSCCCCCCYNIPWPRYFLIYTLSAHRYLLPCLRRWWHSTSILSYCVTLKMSCCVSRSREQEKKQTNETNNTFFFFVHRLLKSTKRNKNEKTAFRIRLFLSHFKDWRKTISNTSHTRTLRVRVCRRVSAL